MFTQTKSNLVRFIALIVMIVMVAAVGLTACADKNAQDAADKAQTSADNAQNAANDAKTKIEELNKTITELKDALAKLEAELEAADGEHEAAIAALEEALAKAEGDLADALEELYDAVLDLEDWNEATAVVVEKLEELKTTVDEFFADTYMYYGDVEMESANEAYQHAMFAILRAPSADAMDEIIADVAETLEALPTIPEKLDAVLTEVEVNGVEYPADGTLLDEAASLLADGSVIAEVYAEIIAYGEDEVNLEEKYLELRAEYNELLIQAGGQALKDRMDAVLADDITLDDAEEVASIETDYAEWEALVGSADLEDKIAEVEGFEDTLEDFFTEVPDRIAELEAAKVAAEAINTAIATLEAAGVKADAATREAIEDLEEQIATWGETYNIPTDADDEDFVQANYDLVAHDKLATIRSNWEKAIETLKKSFEEFVNAVEAIGTVTPDSGEAINTAWKAYFKCAALNQIYNLDAVLGLDEDENVAHYYAKLSTANAQYVEILALIEKIETAIEAISDVQVQYVFEDVVEIVGGVETVTKTAAEVEADYNAAINDLVVAIAAIDADIETLTSDDFYAQDKSVLDADALVALEQARIVPAKDTAVKAILAGYETAVANVQADANETVETKIIKLDNAKDGQIEYVLGIAYDETFGIDNDVTAVEEIERCGNADYINAMFDAALPYISGTVYTICFADAEGNVIDELTMEVGKNVYFTYPEGEAVEGKVFMGWKESADSDKVYPAGAKRAASEKVAITYIPCYEDGLTVADFTLAATETKDVVVDLTNVDTSADIVLTFNCKVDTLATQEITSVADGKYYIFTVNGTKGAFELLPTRWGSLGSGDWATTYENGIQGQEINVVVTVNVDAGTVKVETIKLWKLDVGGYSYSSYEGTIDAQNGLTFNFGSEYCQGVAITNCTVLYTVAE